MLTLLFFQRGLEAVFFAGGVFSLEAGIGRYVFMREYRGL
jgi:hypothetical protein